MEPPGVRPYALAKALGFPGIYEVIRGDRAISADTAVLLGKYFGLHRRNFGSIFRAPTISDLQRAAEFGGMIKLRKAAYSGELTGTR